MSIDALSTIQEEADRLAAALATTDPTRRVPTCPDWNAADLLWHVTEVHEFWAAILASGALTDADIQQIEEDKVPRPDDLTALQERRRDATAALLAQLSARRDEEPAWFWFSQERNVGVTRRMQTHEATIHRVDAELTAGLPVTAIDDEVAAAGLEHVLRVMWPAGHEWVPDWAAARPVAAIEILPESGDARMVLISAWSGTSPGDGEESHGVVARLLDDAADADGLPRATVAGSALALDLWAWGREQALQYIPGDRERVLVDGDPEALAQLQTLILEGHN